MAHDKVNANPYNPKYRLYFRKEKSYLLKFLRKPYGIHHIGSTSVDGLGGENIIDMLLLAPNKKTAISLSKNLVDLGYKKSSNVPGYGYRIFFSCDRYVEGEKIHLHLNVTWKTSDKYKDYLIFRNYLRNHPNELKKYYSLKKYLVRKGGRVREKYTRMKASYIEEIISKAKHLIEPKLELDQNFMIDTSLINKIVSLANIKPRERVLEIGPGTGSLTCRLHKKTNNLILVEKDSGFSPRLREEFKNSKIITANILNTINTLKFDKVVSNIPYSISEPLLKKLFYIDFKLAVLTLPKKFAYGLLNNQSKLPSLSRIFFKMEIKIEVQKSAFSPQPKTNSVVIILKPVNSFAKKVFFQKNMKVKNAIMETLFKTRGKTKNQSRELIKAETYKYLLDTKVKDLNLNQINKLISLLEKIEKAI